MLRFDTLRARMRRALAPSCALLALTLTAVPCRADHDAWNPAMPAARHAGLFDRLFGPVHHAPVALPGAMERGGLAPGLDAQAPAGTDAGGDSWSVIPPPARWVHTSVYDPLRDRLVVFGGQGYGGSSAEVWTLSLTGIPHWTQVLPSGTGPTAAAFHAAIYDSLRDRMLVFGGSDANGVATNAVWSLSFAGNPTWSQLSPTGTPPSARTWSVAVYDRVRDRMVVMGGMAGGSTLPDVWALSLSGTPAWTPVTTTGAAPGGRAAHAGAYDAANDRLVIFGGLDGGGVATNTAFALSFAGTPTWSALVGAGTPPSARYGASATYDRPRQRLVVFAGGTGAPNDNDLWTLSLNATPTWTPLSPTSAPEGRQFHTANYDPVSDRLIVFGGSSGPILSDTWTLPLAAPTQWIPLSCTRRWGHLAFYDPARQRMDVFGGQDDALYNDVWDLPLTGTPAWERLAPAGTRPSARALMAGVLDTKRDRMVIFGGRDSVLQNDSWELTFSGQLSWNPLAPTGTPPSPREDCGSAYDATHDRLIVFGGADSGGTYNEVWTLALAGAPAWTKLAPLGTAPVARGGASVCYDPVRDRLVVWGGYDHNFIALNDAYALSLGGTPTWTKIAASGTLPSARFASACIYDPVRDRFLIVGGTDFNAFFGDTWALPMNSGTPTWSPLSFSGTLPTARSDHRAIYDPVADRLVFFGGENLAGELHDTWQLDFTVTVDAGAGPPPARLAFAGAWPNPAPPGAGAHIALDLPEGGASDLVLAVYDVAGRRVARLAGPGAAIDGALGPGRHVFAWDGRGDGGAAVPSGIYFARAAWGGRSAALKLVLTR